MQKKIEKIIKEYEEFVEEKHKEFQTKYFYDGGGKHKNYECFMHEIDNFYDELVKKLNKVNQEYRNGYVKGYKRTKNGEE